MQKPGGDLNVPAAQNISIQQGEQVPRGSFRRGNSDVLVVQNQQRQQGGQRVDGPPPNIISDQTWSNNPGALMTGQRVAPMLSGNRDLGYATGFTGYGNESIRKHVGSNERRQYTQSAVPIATQQNIPGRRPREIGGYGAVRKLDNL